ncbi:hypothetical protein Tco_0574896 [Tanacetum coccineum]
MFKRRVRVLNWRVVRIVQCVSESTVSATCTSLCSRVEGNELQVFEDLYTSELRKETLPIVFLASELSSLYPASYKLEQQFTISFNQSPLSEDIQCAGFDTRPPMLDRTDFKSWQQRIRLYCRGKENGVDILKSIDEGPFQMGTTRDTLTEGTEDKDMYNADIRATNILLQGLPKEIYTLINHYTDAKDIWDNVKMLLEAVKLNRGLRESNYDQLYAYLKQHEAHANENKMMLDRFTQHIVDPLTLMSNVSHHQYYSQSSTTPPSTYGRHNRGQGNIARGAGAAGYGGAQNRVGNANPGQARQIKCYKCNGEWGALDEEQLLFLAGGQDNAVDKDVDEQPVHDLALNVDNVFQADDYDAFYSNVDEAPTA